MTGWPLARRTRPGYRSGLYPAGEPGTIVPAGPAVIPRGAGQPINAAGMQALVKILHPELLVTEQEIQARQLVRAHRHDHVTQFSLVTQGRLAFLVGDETFTVEEGGIIWRPAGLIHAVWNPGDAPARQIEGHLPGNLQHGFYTRFGELAERLADPPEFAALATEYGMHFDPALTRALEQEHKVTAAPGWLVP